MKNYKIKVINFFNNNTLIKNVGMLASGTILAQIISFAASPVLTRLYTPEDFGLLNVYASLLAIVTVGSALRFEMAIPLPKDDRVASQLVILGVTSVFVVTFVFLFSIIFFDFKKILGIDISILDTYIFFLPVGIFFSGFYLVFNFWAIRVQKYDLIAKTKFYQASSGIGIQILFGIIGLKPLGLIVGSILKQASGFISLLRAYLSNQYAFKYESISYLLATATKYKKFPLVSSWSGMINVLGLNLPVLIIATSYGKEIAGYFGFSLMIISLPITLIGKSISQVFIGQASKLYRSNPIELKKLYKKILSSLFKFGLIPVLILGLWSPDIFSFIFGKNWHTAGIITQVLSVMFLAQFCIIPLSQLLAIVERQGTQLFWDILRLILVILSLIIPNLFGYSYIFSIIAFTFSMVAAYLLLYVLHLITLNKLIKKA